MNSQQQRAIQVQQRPKANKLKHLDDSAVENFFKAHGSKDDFGQFLKGNNKGEDYDEYLSMYTDHDDLDQNDRKSPYDMSQTYKKAYGAGRIEMFNKYLHNDLTIDGIIIKNIRKEKNMNELRIHSRPILFCLIKYITDNIIDIQREEEKEEEEEEEEEGRKDMKKHFEGALDMLFSKGVDVNQTDLDGNTPIFRATMEAAMLISTTSIFGPIPNCVTVLENVVNHLLKNGADLTKKTNLGKSAELCIEEFHRKKPEDENIKRMFNTIKTYAAKFKTSESETSEAKTYAANFKTSEETKEGRSV